MLIQQLVYLTALARERHFGRAAAACRVSQPTLSTAIRRLEAELGTPIVIRGQRFEGLTAEGERILKWAQRIVADCDGLRQDLGSLRDGLSGRLVIGAIPTALPTVSLLTGPVRAAHPGVDVTVISLSSREIERRLHELELHVGLTYLDNEPLRGVRTVPLYAERYLLLTAADGPLGAAPAATWAETAELPLCLLTPDMQNRRIVEGCFREAGVEPRPRVETNSISALYAHVRDGQLSSVIAHAWLHLYGVPEGLRAIPLEPAGSRSIGLVIADRDPEPLLARALVDAVAGLDLELRLAVTDTAAG